MNLKWVLLEIKPPPDVQKSPKIAESIFATLHSSYLPVKWKTRFFRGQVPNFYSLEIVGNGGQMQFLIRVVEGNRSYVEQTIFAQYPEAEIKEVPDYTSSLPRIFPGNEYDMFACNLIFNQPDAYPLRTYPYFEEESGKDEFKRSDPLAPIAEAMGAILPGEHIWLQFLIRPTGQQWVKDAKAVIDKITGMKVKVEDNPLQKLVGSIDKNVFMNESPDKKDEKQEINVQRLTPGQRDTLEQVENKISKLGFKSNIRFIYMARKELFSRARISSVMGLFKQLYSNNLNSLKPDGKTITVTRGFIPQLFPSDKGFFASQQEYIRKVRIYYRYINRIFDKKIIYLNTEELATFFHLPGIGIKAPSFPRVEAKKGQPPAGLPM